MTAIGIDTHKETLAACAVDGLGGALAERTFRNDPAGHRDLLAWAGAVAPGAVVGVEGSASFGAAAARFLLRAGLTSGRFRHSCRAANGPGRGGRARAILATPSRSPG